jgi:hypothetical protein
VDALLGFLVLASMVGSVVGLLMCISNAKRYLGKKVALSSVASFAILLCVVAARGPSPTLSPAARTVTATQSYVEPKPENLSKSKILANFRIRSFAWQKSGFGAIMMARFIIHNDNPMPLKDIEVTCSSSGPSGSIIDTNSRTVFEVVGQKSFLQIDEMNMGFIRSEAIDSKCHVTGFSRT